MLDGEEINATIDKCELLINARGSHDGQSGLYEDGDFAIAILRDAGRYALRIWFRNEPAALIFWHSPSAPGHVDFQQPAERWRPALMAVQAAHS